VHESPEQHSAWLAHDAPTDLHAEALQLGNSPPPHKPEQHSPLLEQDAPFGVHVGPPASIGMPPSGMPASGCSVVNDPHFSLPSLGSREQSPPQQSSGVWQGCPSGLHVQSPHFPPLHRLLQHSAFPLHVSPTTLQAKPLSHVLLFTLHFFEQHSASVVQATPLREQHGPWQRVTP
jgi:hypothetical protein